MFRRFESNDTTSTTDIVRSGIKLVVGESGCGKTMALHILPTDAVGAYLRTDKADGG